MCIVPIVLWVFLVILWNEFKTQCSTYNPVPLPLIWHGNEPTAGVTLKPKHFHIVSRLTTPSDMGGVLVQGCIVKVEPKGTMSTQ